MVNNSLFSPQRSSTCQRHYLRVLTQHRWKYFKISKGRIHFEVKEAE
jgi:hypothetical protein